MSFAGPGDRDSASSGRRNVKNTCKVVAMTECTPLKVPASVTVTGDKSDHHDRLRVGLSGERRSLSAWVADRSESRWLSRGVSEPQERDVGDDTQAVTWLFQGSGVGPGALLLVPV